MATVLCVMNPTEFQAINFKESVEKADHEVFVASTFEDGLRILRNNHGITVAVWQATYCDPEDGPQRITDSPWIAHAKKISRETLHVGCYWSAHSQEIINDADCDCTFALTQVVDEVLRILSKH